MCIHTHVYVGVMIKGRKYQLKIYCCHSLLTKQDMCTIYKSFAQHYNMVVLFIQELLILIYDILMICTPELNSHVHLFFNYSLIIEILQLWNCSVVC